MDQGCKCPGPMDPAVLSFQGVRAASSGSSCRSSSTACQARLNFASRNNAVRPVKMCIRDRIILTAVEKVAIRFRQPGETWLSELTPEEAEVYIAAGEFGAGSMLPKVEAAVRFARSAPGRAALITELQKARAGIAGETGTRIREA